MSRNWIGAMERFGETNELEFGETIPHYEEMEKDFQNHLAFAAKSYNAEFRYKNKLYLKEQIWIGWFAMSPDGVPFDAYRMEKIMEIASNHSLYKIYFNGKFLE